jgi:hypothetical protein
MVTGTAPLSERRLTPSVPRVRDLRLSREPVMRLIFATSAVPEDCEEE